MLQIGDTAPDFTLPDDAGQPVTLSDLLENGPVVLFFYPRDFTPVCTKEACELRDRFPDLSGCGLQVVGVSRQDPESKARFRASLALPYPLLADTEGKVIRAYGAAGVLGTRRITYLVGQDGRIRDAARSALRLGPHLALVGRALTTARSGD